MSFCQWRGPWEARELASSGILVIQMALFASDNEKKKTNPRCRVLNSQQNLPTGTPLKRTLRGWSRACTRSRSISGTSTNASANSAVQMRQTRTWILTCGWRTCLCSRLETRLGCGGAVTGGGRGAFSLQKGGLDPGPRFVVCENDFTGKAATTPGCRLGATSNLIESLIIRGSLNLSAASRPAGGSAEFVDPCVPRLEESWGREKPDSNANWRPRPQSTQRPKSRA